MVTFDHHQHERPIQSVHSFVSVLPTTPPEHLYVIARKRFCNDGATIRLSMTDQERLISRLPHDETFFSDREFVYDPDSDWGTTRTGLIVSKEGELWIHQAPVILGHQWIVSPLREYHRAIGKHVLCNARSGSSKIAVDPAPWLKIQETVLLILRDSTGRRRLLPELIQTVRGNPELEKDLIEDTLRMMDSMGSGSVHVSGDKIWYGLAPLVHGFFDRIDYLSRFSDQLLAQSRQVDFLIRHSGTAGSFREELLRGFLRKVVPGKFRVSTGFIEDCARQLDIIVWDAINYAPLFRENEVVVVPRDSVRAIVEVKTKLNTNALDEALEILFEATARHPQVVPIFQGIFAFEQGYRSDMAIAQRIKEVVPTREYLYLFQTVTAVCVAGYHFVSQQHEIDVANANSWPKPCLYALSSEWPGDTMTSAFVGYLLAHLDLPIAPKRTLMEMFLPIYSKLKQERLLQLFDDEWRPRLLAGPLEHVGTPKGARNYIQRVLKFYEGAIETSDISKNASVGDQAT